MIPLRLVIDTNIVVSAALKPDGLQQEMLRFIRSRSHVVKPARTLQITSDPDDNKFLECADTAGADYLVTGNQRHFPVFWKKTKVITSREFIGMVSPHLIA
jgi:predicted nucleic acid-binding protein